MNYFSGKTIKRNFKNVLFDIVLSFLFILYLILILALGFLPGFLGFLINDVFGLIGLSTGVVLILWIIEKTYPYVNEKLM